MSAPATRIVDFPVKRDGRLDPENPDLVYALWFRTPGTAKMVQDCYVEGQMTKACFDFVAAQYRDATWTNDVVSFQLSRGKWNSADEYLCNEEPPDSSKPSMKIASTPTNLGQLYFKRCTGLHWTANAVTDYEFLLKQLIEYAAPFFYFAHVGQETKISSESRRACFEHLLQALETQDMLQLTMLLAQMESSGIFYFGSLEERRLAATMIMAAREEVTQLLREEITPAWKKVEKLDWENSDPQQITLEMFWQAHEKELMGDYHAFADRIRGIAKATFEQHPKLMLQYERANGFLGFGVKKNEKGITYSSLRAISRKVKEYNDISVGETHRFHFRDDPKKGVRSGRVAEILYLFSEEREGDEQEPWIGVVWNGEQGVEYYFFHDLQRQKDIAPQR